MSINFNDVNSSLLTEEYFSNALLSTLRTSLFDFKNRGTEDLVTDAETAIVRESKNCYIRAPKEKLVIIKGLEDYIVIDSGDVLLIYPKAEEQEIKNIRALAEEKYKGKFS